MTPPIVLRQPEKHTDRQKTPPFSVLKWAPFCLSSCPQFDIRQQDKRGPFCLGLGAPLGYRKQENDP